MDREYHLEEQSVAAAVGRRFGEHWSVRAMGGAVLGGRIDQVGQRFDVNPGFLAALAVAGHFANLGGQGWFFSAALSIGVSSAGTESNSGKTHRIVAQDNRLTALFGRTFADRFSPYLAARAFGGPVNWNIDGSDVVGSDVHHYAIGLGASLAIVPRFDIFGEEMYFGERSLSAGASLAF